MSKAYKPKNYVVRTFKPFASNGFTCTGTMEALDTFEETIVDRQFGAAALLSRGQTSADYVREVEGNAPGTININDVDQGKNMLGFDVIGFKVDLAITDKDDLRQYRTGIREAIKTWAEKSRVRGVRGWRANAIKTPSFEFDKPNMSYSLKFEVILSNTIFYNEKQVTISDNTFTADVADLEKQLQRVTSNLVTCVNYEHSRLGAGKV